ncbi:SDR family oxidoreductase [Rhodococcus sp. ZPP]|uniref:SDR family NAD(P)-dependent oxidoreductase n=1 Tax=Rhodococcus sp. ZPP TaxID=2749906 RepID=UPI001AD87D1F|nr:SDR family oxidoreductase [Rhodococcus sp. ZPP]QTJ67280.1 SDR family oxidoreductase [Rhodococcus sp. ZPP]
MSSIDVADATVFIVGGDSGIGLLIAQHFVRAGTQRIGLIAHDAKQGDAAARTLFTSASGIWALSASGDPASESDADRLLSELSASLGDPDIFINCFSDAGAIRKSVLCAMREHGSGTVVDVGTRIEPPHYTDGIRITWVAAENAAPDAVATAVLQRCG